MDIRIFSIKKKALAYQENRIRVWSNGTVKILNKVEASLY